MNMLYLSKMVGAIFSFVLFHRLLVRLQGAQ